MKAYVVENSCLSYNIELLKRKAGDAQIWAVVKGNGYGLGIVPLAQRLAEHGIDHFCVTEVREAELLRENGFDTAQILMLRSVENAEEINRLIDLRAILTVGSPEMAALVNEIAAQRADVAEVHVKIDTGMGRFGFLPEDVEGILRLYREEKHIAISGIYTHFDCAFNNEARTRAEFAAFQETVQKIRAAGYRHGALLQFLGFPALSGDALRRGAARLRHSGADALPDGAAAGGLCGGADRHGSRPAEGAHHGLWCDLESEKRYPRRHCPRGLV